MGDAKVHRDLKLTPSYDAFWIFALWRALHGEADSDDIAAAVIANLAQFLPAQEDSFGLPPVPSSPAARCGDAGEDDESSGDDLPHSLAEPSDSGENSGPNAESYAHYCCDPSQFSIFHHYFSFKGVFYRFDRPAFARLPTAA
jgi:hypothetical protein